MSITSFDHVAVPISDSESMLDFYRRLGFVVEDSSPPFFSVRFGENKINMHGPDAWQSEQFKLRAPNALPGSGDFCFVWSGSASELHAVLQQASVQILEGPVKRNGGRLNTEGQSVYIRDPDLNLLEFIIYP